MPAPLATESPSPSSTPTSLDAGFDFDRFLDSLTTESAAIAFELARLEHGEDADSNDFIARLEAPPPPVPLSSRRSRRREAAQEAALRLIRSRGGFDSDQFEDRRRWTFAELLTKGCQAMAGLGENTADPEVYEDIEQGVGCAEDIAYTAGDLHPDRSVGNQAIREARRYLYGPDSDSPGPDHAIPPYQPQRRGRAPRLSSNQRTRGSRRGTATSSRARPGDDDPGGEPPGPRSWGPSKLGPAALAGVVL